jgi:hypothetical protein
MEALTAISLVGNIIQFVDFGTKVISVAKEIEESKHGRTQDMARLEVTTKAMRDLSRRMDPSHVDPQTEDERALRQLARECCDLSGQMLNLVQVIAPTNGNSKLPAWRSTFKSSQYKERTRELEVQLADCRGQLNLQHGRLVRYVITIFLDVLTSTDLESLEMQRRFSALADNSSTATDTILVTLGRHQSELRGGVAVASLSDDAQRQLRSLFGVTDKGRQSIAQHLIESGLAFSDMNERFDAVDRAHHQTYQWLLDKGVAYNPALDPGARDRLIHCLSSGTRIFHVAGKLGSGKSTLMKFLCDHPRTHTELLRWAGMVHSLPLFHTLRTYD